MKFKPCAKKIHEEEKILHPKLMYIFLPFSNVCDPIASLIYYYKIACRQILNFLFCFETILDTKHNF